MPNVEDEAFTSIPDTLHTLVNGDGTDPVVWIRSDQHFFCPPKPDSQYKNSSDPEEISVYSSDFKSKVTLRITDF